MKKTPFLLASLFFATVLVLAACGGGGGAERLPQDSGADETQAPESAAASVPSGDPTAGEDLFIGTCSACHGPEGKGVQGLGKDMTTSEFIASKSDAELVEFIKEGRDPSHPLNDTGVAMPPKGGNPSLSDEDLYDIVAYVRTIHE